MHDIPLLLTKRGLSANQNWLRAQLDSTQEGRADLSVAVHRPAKEKDLDPSTLAEDLASEFRPGPEFSRADADGGFLNFHANPTDLVARTIRTVLGLGERYGHAPVSSFRAGVEHTSANTTGAFHIGRVRNAFIGDTLSRVIGATGTPVTRQYYVDDLGRQAAMITWIWTKPVASWPDPIRATLPTGVTERPPGEKPDHWRGRPYPAVSDWIKQDTESAAEVASLVLRLEQGESVPGHRELAEEILGGMTASLARAGVTFDEFVWESSLLHDGSVEEVVSRLEKAPHAVVEENGAHAIDASSYGLPKESARVIVTRGDGSTLYVTRDVAFHLKKFARFPRTIDVLGQDHHLHARTLTALLSEIGESRRPEFVIYQDITVPDGGRMSTRKGTAVHLDDLLDEAVERAEREVRARREDLSEEEVASIADRVGVGAVRYHILRVAPEKSVVFRWEDALSFEGRSGPFLQYAYARSASLLRKAGAAGAERSFDPGQLQGAEEMKLVRRIARLPGLVQYVGRTAHVHTLAQHGHDLADQFNRFSQTVPVLKGGAAAASRLTLVAAFREALGATLDLLGVSRLERM